MQAIPRLRHLTILRNLGATQLSSFHSTPVCDEKWKKKWNSAFNRGQHQQPSKNYIRYVTRQKRADAKKALKRLLFNGGPFESASQNENQPKRKKKRKKNKKSSCDSELEDDTDGFSQTGRSEAHHSEKAKSKQRRKQRRGYLTEDDEHHETVFEAKYENRWYTWSFNAFYSSSFYSSTSRFDWQEYTSRSDRQQYTSGFDWQQYTYNRNDRHKRWEAAGDTDSDNEGGHLGSHSDRTILGLPPYGPLKIEDVKSAYYLSALKWHPDKHQGPSQAEAEEKFKLCASAYNSLCRTLSAA